MEKQHEKQQEQKQEHAEQKIFLRSHARKRKINTIPVNNGINGIKEKSETGKVTENLNIKSKNDTTSSILFYSSNKSNIINNNNNTINDMNGDFNSNNENSNSNSTTLKKNNSSKIINERTKKIRERATSSLKDKNKNNALTNKTTIQKKKKTKNERRGSGDIRLFLKNVNSKSENKSKLLNSKEIAKNAVHVECGFTTSGEFSGTVEVNSLVALKSSNSTEILASKTSTTPVSQQKQDHKSESDELEKIEPKHKRSKISGTLSTIERKQAIDSGSVPSLTKPPKSANGKYTQSNVFSTTTNAIKATTTTRSPSAEIIPITTRSPSAEIIPIMTRSPSAEIIPIKTISAKKTPTTSTVTKTTTNAITSTKEKTKPKPKTEITEMATPILSTIPSAIPVTAKTTVVAPHKRSVTGYIFEEPTLEPRITRRRSRIKSIDELKSSTKQSSMHSSSSSLTQTKSSSPKPAAKSASTNGNSVTKQKLPSSSSPPRVPLPTSAKMQENIVVNKGKAVITKRVTAAKAKAPVKPETTIKLKAEAKAKAPVKSETTIKLKTEAKPKTTGQTTDTDKMTKPATPTAIIPIVSQETEIIKPTSIAYPSESLSPIPKPSDLDSTLTEKKSVHSSRNKVEEIGNQITTPPEEPTKITTIVKINPKPKPRPKPKPKPNPKNDTKTPSTDNPTSPYAATGSKSKKEADRLKSNFVINNSINYGGEGDEEELELSRLYDALPKSTPAQKMERRRLRKIQLEYVYF
eukprot:Pgem_evm1s8608